MVPLVLDNLALDWYGLFNADVPALGPLGPNPIAAKASLPIRLGQRAKSKQSREKAVIFGFAATHVVVVFLTTSHWTSSSP
jgi:hypothetical protein